jgi:hypothetical protein
MMKKIKMWFCNIFQNKYKCPIKMNSYVVFDVDSCPNDIYEKYFKDTFPEGKLFVFMGEIAQILGHCILLDLESGKIIGMYHTNNFREANDDEY